MVAMTRYSEAGRFSILNAYDEASAFGADVAPEWKLMPIVHRLHRRRLQSGDDTNVASFFYMTPAGDSANEEATFWTCGKHLGALLPINRAGRTATLALLSKPPMPVVSKALALEYAASNIRFNTVSRGNINTPMHARRNHAALAEFHPLARMGRNFRHRRRNSLSPERYVRNGQKHPSGGWGVHAGR